MEQKAIERILSYHSRNGRVELSQVDLLNRTEPLVILGEAGMGKSYLLEWLATHQGYTRCTARQLINSYDPNKLLGNAQILVIDALDEVSVQREGDAVDLVLRKLGQLGCPRFIVSCRVADWSSATGTEAIQEQYSQRPLELHLAPLTDNDVINFLSISFGLEVAKKVVEHFNARGLKGLLGNPQTVNLIVSVVESGQLPETCSELFDQAIKLLLKEHNNSKAGKQLSEAKGLDAAGAAFAGLILSGSEVFVRKSAVNVDNGELLLADISTLPGGDDVEFVLDTRLFKADGSDRFTYIHRRVGEFLGARWLAQQADDQRKQKRIQSLFHYHGLVPASLRGMHAWLGRYPAFTGAVMEADPMGVIEYGDADDLTVYQAHVLLKALENLAVKNPRFLGWGPHSVRGIAQTALIEDLRRLISTPETPVGLSILALEAIRDSKVATLLVDDLRRIVLDSKAVFACRNFAGEALAHLPDIDCLQTTLHALYEYGDEISIRLAIELVDETGYEKIDDSFIVDLVIAWANSRSNTIGVLMGLERRLPVDRIGGFLDHLTIRANELGKPHHRQGDDILTDLAYYLIVRCVKSGNVTGKKLWYWLEPFDASIGYNREIREQFASLIRENDSLRLDIQRLVLFELPGDQSILQRKWCLCERSTGLEPTAADIIRLLEGLNPADRKDDRWRQLIQLIRHDGDKSAEVREAARRFATHRPDMLRWIDTLANPRTPRWELRRAKNARKHRAKQATRFAEHRKEFSQKLNEIRRGDFAVLVSPAQAYLKQFTDIGNDVPPEQRIGQWLGDKLATVIHDGFEAFLQLDPPEPSAQHIVEALIQEQCYPAGNIIIAAFAERLRKRIGFEDLPGERLIAGLFELFRSRIDEHAGIVGLREALKGAIRDRGLWEQTIRMYIEPQLASRCKSVDSLNMLLGEDANSELCINLAAEWLESFPDLPMNAENALIEILLRARRFEELRRNAASRRGMIDDEHRRNWDAVSLIVDFQTATERLESTQIEPALLWYIRDLPGVRFGDDVIVLLNPTLLEWIIRQFRSLWPVVERPRGVITGNTSHWDANDYIFQLINRLGNDTSEEAMEAFVRLRDAPTDSYSDAIKAVMAEQERIRVESLFVPHTIEAINAVVRNSTPKSVTDLQVTIIEELLVAQAKIKSDDAESWRGFYDDKGVPFEEERCRDHLLGLLRQGSREITFDPETHVAGDKEVDITCSVERFRLPIEIKGQWHKDLWQGADKQLDKLYTPDWRAEKHGIYLVLWFGHQEQKNKRLKNPKEGEKIPTTPEELRAMLIAGSKPACEGRISIFVLDIERS